VLHAEAVDVSPADLMREPPDVELGENSHA
jgi:hypothetical protein